MALMSVAATNTQAGELPEVAAPSRVAPNDARELSRIQPHAKAQLWPSQ